MTLEEAKKIIYELDSESRCNDIDYEAGFYDAQDRVLRILEEIDAEPVGNPDKLTLTELARELRKLFKFKYLTSDACKITLWVRDRPVCDRGNWWCADELSYLLDFYENTMDVLIDLSEYADEHGFIDISKCIVEVE